jgi:hypothetical protein
MLPRARSPSTSSKNSGNGDTGWASHAQPPPAPAAGAAPAPATPAAPPVVGKSLWLFSSTNVARLSLSRLIASKWVLLSLKHEDGAHAWGFSLRRCASASVTPRTAKVHFLSHFPPLDQALGVLAISPVTAQSNLHVAPRGLLRIGRSEQCLNAGCPRC